MNKYKVRFAIVGVGHIGKRQAKMISENEEAELVALCDIKSSTELDLQHLKVPFFNDIRQMLLTTNSIEVVCVCTPNGLHAEHAVLALQAGKHVVCEKPMALSKADCERIIYQSLQSSRYVFCVMQNRYSPPSVWIKNLLQQKKLGDIYMVQINCFWNRDDRYYKSGDWRGNAKLDGGTLFTQFSHFIDIMYWLFGDITNIQARFNDFKHQHSTEFEDSGFVTFDFVHGGMGNINYSTSIWDKNFESSMTIIASKGTVKIGGQYMNRVEYCHIEDYDMPDLPAPNPAHDYGQYKGTAANHVYIIKNVIDVLKNRNSITTNALEGLKVVEIIERIYALRPEYLSQKKLSID